MRRSEETAAILKRYGINSRRIPNDIAERALDCIQRIERGAHVYDFAGKAERMKWDRNVISIHVQYRWRLLVKETGDLLEIIGLYSHEDYNKLASGRD